MQEPLHQMALNTDSSLRPRPLLIPCLFNAGTLPEGDVGSVKNLLPKYVDWIGPIGCLGCLSEKGIRLIGTCFTDFC
jgi:hypothetical protein